jgi:hypothetical protein
MEPGWMAGTGGFRSEALDLAVHLRRRNAKMMKFAATIALAGALMSQVALAAPPSKPKSVIHVINVRFKADAAKADIDKAISMVGTMEFPGLKNVWLKPIKVQGGESKFTHVLVMEFESEAALAKYSGSDAQKKWYEAYLKVRDLSNTHDITN